LVLSCFICESNEAICDCSWEFKFAHWAELSTGLGVEEGVLAGLFAGGLLGVDAGGLSDDIGPEVLGVFAVGPVLTGV
jgi:hypothetical protein